MSVQIPVPDLSPRRARRLSLEEQAVLFEEWFLQMFFGFCCPLED